MLFVGSLQSAVCKCQTPGQAEVMVVWGRLNIVLFASPSPFNTCFKSTTFVVRLQFVYLTEVELQILNFEPISNGLGMARRTISQAQTMLWCSRMAKGKIIFSSQKFQISSGNLFASLCTDRPSPQKKNRRGTVCDLPLVIVFRNNFAYII